MSEQSTFQAQATRSFGDYLQGAWYTIDRNDETLMTLLGAGYFDTEGNDNLTRQRFDYEAGEVVPAAISGIRGTMANQEHVNVEEGYQPDYDAVEVPEKKTGSERATTADDNQENQDSGEVGTEQGGDSTSRQRSRTSTRQSRDTRNS